MNKGFDLFPIIPFLWLLEPLIVKEGISGQAEARIKKMIHLNKFSGRLGAPP